MGREKGPMLGQITFRLPPEQHKELMAMAESLNSDVSGLVKLMLAEATPAFQTRVTELTQRRLAATYRVESDLVALVHRAIRAGWDAGGRETFKRMKEVIADVRELDDKALQSVLLAAERELSKAAEWGLMSAEDGLDKFLEGKE